MDAGTCAGPMGQAYADKYVSERPRLGVRAIEDGDIAGAAAIAIAQPVDFFGNEAGFVVFVIGYVADDFWPVPQGGPQLFRTASRIFLNDRISRAQNILS